MTGAFVKIGFFRTDSDLLFHDVVQGNLFEKASVMTIREKLIHTAVHIRVLKTKVNIEFPANHPYIALLEEAIISIFFWYSQKKHLTLRHKKNLMTKKTEKQTYHVSVHTVRHC